MSRSVISEIDKKIIFDSAANGEDYIQFASRLNIKAATARKIVSRTNHRGGIVSRSRGGANNTKVDDEFCNFIKSKADENSQITLMAIKTSLEKTFPEKPKLRLMRIVRVLNGHLYSLKNIQAVSVERNSEASKRKRGDHSKWFLLNAHKYSAVLYVDECGFNL